METKTITPEEAKELAQKKYSDFSHCIEELTRILLIAIRKNMKQTVEIYCYETTKNGEYVFSCNGETTDYNNLFSKETIKKTINSFRRAGWKIKTVGKFSKFSSCGYEIDLPN